jgi:hypothetical protein
MGVGRFLPTRLSLNTPTEFRCRTGLKLWVSVAMPSYPPCRYVLVITYRPSPAPRTYWHTLWRNISPAGRNVDAVPTELPVFYESERLFENLK